MEKFTLTPVHRSPSIDETEVEKFTMMADSWWDPKGKFRPLHLMNPIRIQYINEQLQYFKPNQAYKNLRMLDIGCGGGLLCEPLARLGASITGIDVIEKNLEIAKAHAHAQQLPITYTLTSVEDFALNHEAFDVVFAMEVLEHVADLSSFTSAISSLCKQDSLVFFSTINKTPLAWLGAILTAEYIMKWLPKGTHEFSKFLSPQEVRKLFEVQGLEILNLSGMIYNPLMKSWSLNPRQLSINYIGVAKKIVRRT